MNVCCIFTGGKEAAAKLNLRNLTLLATLKDSYRHEHCLYECPSCKGLLFYKYEEIADFTDDYEFYKETLFPVSSWDEAYRIEKEYPFTGFPNGKPSLSRCWDSRDEAPGPWWPD